MSGLRETEDWRLGAWIDWKPKKEPYDIPCPCCSGKGEVGGGFKDLDGPRECPQCFGRRRIRHPGPTEPKPEVPADLIEHMRKAWIAYFEQDERPATQEGGDK